MKLYYYLFLQVYKAYQKSGTSKPEIYAVGVVGLLQIFTLFEIIAICNYFNLSIPNLDTKVIFILAFIYIFLLYFLFTSSMTIDKIEAKLQKLSTRQISLLKSFTWVHVILTVSLFFLIYNIR